MRFAKPYNKHIVYLITQEVKLPLQCRDVLYLDLALETAVRSTVEAALSVLCKPDSEKQLASHACLILDLLELCAGNACLSMASNTELVMVHEELKVSP